MAPNVVAYYQEQEGRLDMGKLYRSQTNKMIAGICGGLAETYSTDSTLVRLLTVLLCLVTGILPVVIVYIIAWIVVPVGSSPS